MYNTDFKPIIPSMQHLSDLDLWEQIYMANLQRTSEKNPDRNNIPLVYEIIAGDWNGQDARIQQLCRTQSRN